MAKKKPEWEPIHTQALSSDCTLVVFEDDWQIEYKAGTFEEDKDLKYKVTSKKVDQFLLDLKKNLRLFFDIYEDGEKPGDITSLRDMLIRFRTKKPGVYLTEQFCLARSWEDYEEIKKYIGEAKAIATKMIKGGNAE